MRHLTIGLLALALGLAGCETTVGALNGTDASVTTPFGHAGIRTGKGVLVNCGQAGADGKSPCDDMSVTVAEGVELGIDGQIVGAGNSTLLEIKLGAAARAGGDENAGTAASSDERAPAQLEPKTATVNPEALPTPVDGRTEAVPPLVAPSADALSPAAEDPPAGDGPDSPPGS